MRIAVFHNLPSGGAKRSAYEWMKRMTVSHELDLFLYDEAAENFLDLRPLVRRVTVIPSGTSGDRGGIHRLAAYNNVVRASRKVVKLINVGQYDIAFVMQCKVSNSPWVLRGLKIPSLYFCQEPLTKALEPHIRAGDRAGASLKRFFLKWMIQMDALNARHATLICANSLYSRENIYRSYGVYPRTNYLGVDVAHFAPKPTLRERTVLSVGALHPSKGQDFIIRAVAQVDSTMSVRFIFNLAYGPEGYRRDLETLASRCGVTTSFHQLPSEDTLIAEYSHAAVTAYPSRLEPLGLVALESMACETPVVGFAEGGIRETVRHNITGILTENDELEFGRALKAIADNEALRANLGRNGREWVSSEWSWDRSYDRLEANMRRTLDRHSFNSGTH